MQCTLLVPDLMPPRAFHDDAWRDLELPALQRLLARADRAPLAQQGYEAWLCQAFGVTPQPDWPVAPLTFAADGGDPAQHFWLRADPVHLHATRDRVTLSDAGELSIRPDEAATLVAALNAYIADDTREFLAPHPQRWYLRLTAHPQIATRTLLEAVGRDIRPLLPAGPQALHWDRTTNEIQMLLHAHAVNEAREDRSELTINSVWLWGGGTYPEVLPGGFHAVWSDEPLAIALAQGAGLKIASAERGAQQWLNAITEPQPDRHHLIVLDQLMLPAHHGDIARWRERAVQLEQAWFAPLLGALNKRQLGRLRIVTVGPEPGARYDVTPLRLLRFWRSADKPVIPAADVPN